MNCFLAKNLDIIRHVCLFLSLTYGTSACRDREDNKFPSWILRMKLILILYVALSFYLLKRWPFTKKGLHLVRFNYWVHPLGDTLVNTAIMIKLSNQRSPQKKPAALFLVEIKLPGLHDKLSSFSHDFLIVVSKNSNFNINIRRTSFMCEFYLYKIYTIVTKRAKRLINVLRLCCGVKFHE